MNKIKRSFMIAAAVLVLTVNAAGVFAATPVPSKTNGNATTQTTQKTESTDKTETTAKATEKASATAKAKATTKATAKATSKATAKATSKPKATSDTKASQEPEATEDAEIEVTIEPTAEPVTAKNDPLVFTEEADKGVLGTEEETMVNAKRYTTKGGAFGWFVLSVIVNAIISFIIGNRFYKMSRKDTHVLAEVRALKRDIDAKMQNNIGGFSEYETVIENTNSNFGLEEKPQEEKTEDDVKAEEMANEIYRKWESQVLAAKEREAARSNMPSHNRPNRNKMSQKKNQNGFSDKVKGFINDVFPFDKD